MKQAKIIAEIKRLRTEEYFNIGKEKFTRKGIPWILKFSLAFDSNLLANREELRLKKCKNRNYIEQYIKVNLVEHPDM